MRRDMLLSILALLSLLFATLLSGCGSSKKEGEAQPTTEATRIDNANCTNNCHAATPDPVVAGAQIVAEWNVSKHKAVSVDCQSCHGGGSLHWGLGPIPYPDPEAAGICKTCHNINTLPATNLGNNVGVHFSNYTTSLAAQYVSQSDPDGVQCRKCHNPHDPTSRIQFNKDWAESGHGDTTFSNDGNANNDSVNSHYPWTTASRDACSKCHTTTGNVRFSTPANNITVLTNNATGATVITNGPIMSNNKKNETIMCSACHQDYSWARRSIGAQTLEYTYNNVPVVLPDKKDSNLCLVCHSGRGNFQSRRSTRFEGHHLATGADLYAALTHVGFEFTGRTYPTSFPAHEGINVTPNAGPCVSCHMKAANSHTFEPVIKDVNGVITSIKAQLVCNTCHTSGSQIGVMDAARLENESLGYQEAGTLLLDYLANKPGTGNFTGAPVTVTNSNVATLDPRLYGAYQNSFIASEDPGGFVHNVTYVKTLIFDSIDGLDNGVYDGTITINATNYPNAAAWFEADGAGVATRP